MAEVPFRDLMEAYPTLPGYLYLGNDGSKLFADRANRFINARSKLSTLPVPLTSNLAPGRRAPAWPGSSAPRTASNGNPGSPPSTTLVVDLTGPPPATFTGAALLLVLEHQLRYDGLSLPFLANLAGWRRAVLQSTWEGLHTCAQTLHRAQLDGFVPPPPAFAHAPGPLVRATQRVVAVLHGQLFY